MTTPTAAQAQSMIDIGNQLVVIGNTLLATPAPPTSGVLYAAVNQEIADGTGAMWKYSSTGNLYRNGMVVPGWTDRLARDSTGHIKHHGSDNNWYLWNGSGWSVSSPPV